MIPDTVEVGGSLRGLSQQHFYRLIERATEVLLPPPLLPNPLWQDCSFRSSHLQPVMLAAHGVFDLILSMWLWCVMTPGLADLLCSTHSQASLAETLAARYSGHGSGILHG